MFREEITMKTINKLFALLLSALLLCACFACNPKPASAPTSVPAADATDAPADAPADPPENAPEDPVVDAGADGDDWAYIQDKGTLVIGITLYAPMNYNDESGKLVGFDTELAETICAELGVTPEFIVIDWASKELELSSKNIDCIWNGLTVTEERRQNMDFSDSYLENQQVIVVRASAVEQFADLGAFDGQVVVAEEESAGASAIALAMPGADYIALGTQTDALLEVKAGTAAAAVVDLAMAESMIGAGRDYDDLAVLDIAMTSEEFAIGFRRGSSATAVFSEALSKLYADGTVAALAEKYGITSLLLDKG
jgi:polar amino acid transport system substrate-binding protein